MDYNYQHRGTNSKTHSRSGFQYADWLIQVLIEIVIILVKWTAILYDMKNMNNNSAMGLDIVTVYWAEGWSDEVNARVRIPVSEEVFKKLTGAFRCSVKKGDLEFFAAGEAPAAIYDHFIAQVPLVHPFEDQYVTIGEYTLEA